MLYDAVVIGAGPAGITAALYLVRSGVSVALVENAAPGGQIISALNSFADASTGASSLDLTS